LVQRRANEPHAKTFVAIGGIIGRQTDTVIRTTSRSAPPTLVSTTWLSLTCTLRLWPSMRGRHFLIAIRTCDQTVMSAKLSAKNQRKPDFFVQLR
jgi:hypothetical protein